MGLRERSLASIIGWAVVASPASVAAGEKVLDAEELEELTLDELLEVTVVTASRHEEGLADAPATVYVVTEDDILRYGLRDLRDVLRIVPGVEWSFEQMTLQGGLRGFPTNWSNTLLQINGREVQNIIASEPFISYQFQTYNVRQVEVVMAPASALYGANAFVGVINVITKNGDVDGGYVQQSAGSWGTASTGLVVGATYDSGVSIYASANFFDSDNEDFGRWLSEHADEWRSRTPWTPPTFNPKYPYRNDARSVSVEAEARYRGFYLGTLVLQNYSEGGFEQARPTFGERQVKREQFLRYAGVKRRIHDRVELGLEYDDLTENDIDVFTFDNAAPQPIPPDSTHDPAGEGSVHAFFGVDGAKKRRGEAQLDVQLATHNLLILGGVIERVDLGAGFLYGSAYNLLPTGNVDLSRVAPEWRRFTKGGVFIQDQQRIGDRVELTAGGRLDDHSNTGVTFNPRGALVVRPSRQTTVKLLAGTAYREPSVFELSAMKSADLVPERIASYELRLDQRVGDFELGTSLYYNRVRDLIVPEQLVLETGMSAFANGGDAHSLGLEQTVVLRTERLHAFGSYAFVDREDYEDGALSSDALEVSPHKVILGVSLAFRSGRSFVSAYHLYNSSVDGLAARLDATGVEILRVPAYQNLTITAATRARLAGVDLHGAFTVDNVLGTDNLRPNVRGIEPRAYPQNHFNVLATVRVLFDR